MKKSFVKKLSVGYSSSYFNFEQWKQIIEKYSDYIHDIYFSPVEDLCFQTRRNTYNFKATTIEERREQISEIIKLAQKNDIKTKLVLNVPNMISNVNDNVKQYLLYKERFSIDYVTTFVSVAEEIKKYDSNAKILCSYNQGITNIEMLKNILEKNIFYAIVLGERFIRDFKAFELIKNYGVKNELLVNNACMLNCGTFCSIFRYCESNFNKNLYNKGINRLYAETSLFPEELYTYYEPSKLIDIYKLSTRPCEFWELDNMIESYISGVSEKYLCNDIRNYHLYGRLTFFIKHYGELDYYKILSLKKQIWDDIVYNGSNK